MKTFLLVIKRYIQTVSQAVVSLVKPEFHLPVLTRAVLRKGLPRYKLSHNSLPSVTLWDRKEVNPGVMRVYPLITHMRAFKAVNPRWSPMAIPHSHCNIMTRDWHDSLDIKGASSATAGKQPSHGKFILRYR